MNFQFFFVPTMGVTQDMNSQESIVDPNSSTASKKSKTPNPDFPCYIHSVSPIKTTGNEKDFNLILQMRTK